MNALRNNLSFLAGEHMKILITTDWYAPVVNGVVVSVLLLQRELEKLGHEVRVVTLAPGLRSFRRGQVYYIGSVNAGKIYPGARLRLGRSEALLRQLEAWGPDIVHSQCEFSTLRVAMAIARRMDVPVVHTYHTVYEDYTHYLPIGKRTGKYVATTLSRRVCRKVACVVVPSGKVERLLRSYGVSRRIEVIPTGIDLRSYREAPDPRGQEALRRKLGIPKGKLVLLYLGRMAKEKGLEELMAHLARAGRKDAVVLLVGDGPDREEVLACAREKKLPVIYAGMVPHGEVPQYYRLGDIFVTASTSETQGLTYFEALASGLPVLCRKDPCLEGVIEDGVNGWQYETEEAFCLRLAAFCGDKELRARMSQAAEETAERYSAEAFGRAAEALYRSVLEQENEAVGCR